MSDDELPLSFQQERLWFFHQIQPDSAAYNQSLGLRLTGPLDVAALERAVSEIVARHESLRTSFPARDGRPYQRIAPAAPVPLDLADEGGVADDMGRPFDIENGPLCRWRLYRRGDGEHLLLAVLHHLVTDGWSFGVLTTELGALYDAFRDGGTSPLPELPVQYADYALWQRDSLDGDALETQLGHWRAELDGIEPLDLPTDRPRPAEQTFNGDRHWFRVPAPLSADLLDLARNEGVTPFMALVSVFQILLGRAAGQDEVVVGVPVAGRDQAELSGLIGYFVNTLVLRGDLSGDPSFRELLGRTRERAADGYRHLDLPLQWVTSELKYRRDLSRNALFDVMFAWQDVPASVPEMAGLEVAFDSPDATVNLVDLQLNCYPDDEGILGHVIYNRDLFDAAGIERLAARFTALLAQAVADPGSPLSRLVALGAGERELIDATGTGDVATGTISELFEERVAADPGAVAVRHDGQRVTYAELGETAGRIAGWLRAEGIGPGDVVGVRLPRGVPLIAALLGVLRSGAAYLPLDPEHPAARLEFMLADSGAALVLSPTEAPGTRTVALEEVLRDAPEENDGWRPAHPRDTAYLIYTSGSTGTPKAVPVDHAGLSARVGWMRAEYGLGPSDRVLQFASTGFDTHVEEVYPCLLSGGSLLLTDPRQVDVPALLATPEGRELTVLDLPTPYWHEMVRLAESGDLRVPDAVRLVIIGADKAEAGAADAWRRLVGRRLVNTYGPTEATVVATFADLTDDEPGTVPPIGRPVAGVRAHVLDASLRPAGVGVPGELYLGGTGIARGYLGRPGLTAERFVADPYGPPGERLYRTGDRVRWREDGRLEFLGRLDHQVKIRGFRVELNEVEAVLREHPDVTAAVAVIGDEGRAKRLTGYVTGADGADVRAFAAGRLPEYMVPAEIVTLAEIPLTATGKPDRRALPAPGRTAETSRAPRGRTEEVLAEVWREVLGLESVGAEDNFFEVGGDSIVSIQVVARARGRGVLITPRLLFRHQTIAALAAVARAAPERTAHEPLTGGDVPLLPMQRWFLTRPFEDRHYFTQSVLVSVPDGTDETLIARALDEVAARHAALRARFTRDGEWRQTVVPPGECRPPVCERVDLSGAPDPALALRDRAVELKSGFDLGDPPLVRAALFALGEGECRLLVAAHHLVVDAVSWHILLEDLAEGYERLRTGAGTAPAGPTSSVRDHAEELHAAVLDELPYWNETSGHREDAGDLASTRTVTVGLDEADTEALLTAVPRTHGCRINDVLLTALARAWRARTGDASLLVDLESHGREPLSDDVDLTRTVGWFTAQYPVRLECGGDLSQTLRGVRETLRRVPGGGVGYGVLRYLRGELPTSAAPVGFNYLGRFEPGGLAGALFGPAGEDTGPDTGIKGPREHRVEINGGVFGGRLSMTFAYSADLDSEETIGDLADAYVAELGRLVSSARSEDRYPLSPLQQGLLFHAMGEAASGEYVVQVELRLRGQVDPGAVRSAWRQLAARHTALRSSVHWQGLDEPVQQVHDDVTVPFEEFDWRDDDPEGRLAAHLAADRARGFDLDRAPLLRVCLARLSGDAYAMVVTSHHIVLDGWSGARLLEEFFALYAGRPVDATPARPFRDYVTWLAGQDPAAAERYWRERLAGFGEPSRFRDDPPGTGPAPVDLVVTLPEDRSARLAAFARREHLTMSTLLHAAWAVVLGRHAGTDDVVYGSTVSGRPPELDGVESMIGLFINTLPVRFALPPDRPARGFLREVQDELISLREFEYSSLADAQRHAGTQAGHRLFDNILVVENYPVSGDATGGPSVEQARTREQTGYPLTVAVTLGAELLVRLSYRPDRWDEGDARRLAGHLFTVLEAFADEPDQALGRTPMLSPSERRHLVASCNDTGPGHAAPSLAALVEAQVRRTPDAPAISFEGTGLTYAELNGRANHLARRLRALGVRRGDVVAVCADRSPLLPVALLAVLKAGGAYLPLDPGYPRRRLDYMLADSGARVVLADTDTDFGDALRLTDDATLADDLELDLTPDDLAYVIYTSGSTGRPKGVANTHGAIGNRLLWMQDRYRLTAADTVLQKTPSSFDVSVWEFFWPLICGARMVLARPDGHRDPAYLAELIGRERVTTTHFVPSMLRAFLDQEDLSSCASLRRVLCSGEELGVETARRAAATLGAELHNLYGPTEAAIDVTSWRYDPDTDLARVPIGRPIDGIRVHLLDRRMRPVPSGAVGEIHLGGVGLARGYLGRPSLTAERFVADPFGAPGDRLYRTGDLARRRPDGAVEFLGRADDQVKLRGFRIELGEISARIEAHPDVRAAAAAVLPDPSGAGRLVGYVVAPEVPDGLREHLSVTLPEYMVPNGFVALPELPLTPSGKLDRSALPAPQQPSGGSSYRPPSTPAEEALTGIWQSVLGLDKIGADDDFFDLGGHSLLAMRVIARASRELPGASLSVMDLFAHPTVAGLASLAERSGRERGLLHRLTPPRTVRASVICVPYGGGSAAVYKPLADVLPGDHALYSVALPGHDTGLPDEPLSPLPDTVARCAEEIAATVDGPLIVYGHCLGGSTTALALARLLESRGREVLAVYTGASFPSARLPGRFFHRVARYLPTGRLTGDRSYYNFIRSLGGLNERLPDEEMHVLARALRHDNREAEQFFTEAYAGPVEPRLKAPIVSVVAERDPTTDLYEERHKEWLHFSGRAELVVVGGADHFFLRGQAERLAEIITTDRSTPAEQDPPPASRGPAVPEPAAHEPAAHGRPAPGLRRFVAVTAGELVSQIGSGLTAFALGLWVYLTTHSLTEFALIEMFATLPGVLFAPLVGALVDRSSRRRVMVAGNTVAGVAQGALALLAWRGHLGIAAIYALLSVASLAMMFERVAFLSAIPQLAPKRYAFRLNGIVQVAMGLAQIVAPLLAVSMLHAFGLTGVLTADSVSFAVVTVVLVAVRFPAALPALRRESLRAEIGNGFRYVRDQRGLRDLLVYFAALSVLTAPSFLLVTPLVLPFGSVSTIGGLLVVAGVGTLAGGLTISLWGGPQRVMAGVLGSSVAGGAAIALVGLRPSVPLIGAGLFAYLVSSAIFQGCYTTMIQLRVPPLLQGRVFAFVQMVSLGAAPIAYVTAGPLGERLFEPLLARDGALSGTVGRLIGTGPGRGIALMYLLAGAAVVLLTLVARRRPSLWNLEYALPGERENEREESGRA